MSMSDLITLGLYALATARLVRLAMEDKLTERLRNRILSRLPRESLRQYLISCVWCLSIWSPFGVLYVLVPHHPAALAVAATLAFSWLTVILRDLQRLLNGKANLYQMPMPEPDPPMAENKLEQEAHS